jgi:septum formation inhibitor-activating ATPase MinD
MKLSKTTVNFYDELLLIKAAQNGSVEAEDMLYSHHKKILERELYKYKFLHVVLDDLPCHIEYGYRIAIHKYNIESDVKLIDLALWFIKNTLERKCSAILNLSIN